MKARYETIRRMDKGVHDVSTIDKAKRERLRQRLQDRTISELRAQLYLLVPHLKDFYIEAICDYASKAELEQMLVSFEEASK